MPGEKKVFPTYKVYSPDDLSRKWFVYWYEGRQRRRKYGSINQHTTRPDRQKAADALIEELKATHRRRISKAEEAIRQYIAQNASRWRKSTLEHYQGKANLFFDYLGGRELTAETLCDFLQHIQDSRHPTTYNKYVVTLKKLLVEAGYGYLTAGIKNLRASSTPARYFQRHQASRLLAAIDEQDSELGLFVRFLYYCFIRPRELCSLRVGDILLEEGEIRVPGKASKNAKTQFVVIPEAFQPWLVQLYDRSPGEYLFPSAADRSKRIGKNTMYRRHKKILDALGFGEGYTLYSWKHTGAVAAAKAGISIKELQIQLRHHSLDETDKYLRQMGVKDLSKLKSNFPALD